MSEKKESLLVFLIILIGYLLSSWFVSNSITFLDEHNILGPIKESITGMPWPVREYPDFPYLFYKYLYLFFQIFFKDLELFPFSRTINSLLLPINTFLFYVIAKKYIRGIFLVVACLFFTFSPGVFFSSTTLKTESLTLLEFLLTLFFTQRFLKKKEIKWALLSGMSAALGVTTKYYVMFPLVFFSGQFISLDIELPFLEKIKKIIKDKYSYFFILGFLISFLITWPSFWNIYHTVNETRITSDTYFTQTPTITKAVDELFAFPYGKYSYAFVYAFPMNFGILIYFTAIFGIFSRKIPREVFFLVGGPTLLYFILITNFTLLRPLYQFTICAPFFILGSIFFLQEIYFKIPKLLKYLLLFLCLIYPSVEHDNLAKFYKGYTYILEDIFFKFDGDLAKFNNIQKNDPHLLLLTEFFPNSAVKPEDLENYIEREKPKMIFIHKALADNICKYKKAKNYLKTCDYLSNLINGRKKYKVYWKGDLEIPINFLGLDPEYSSGFYLLKRE